MSRKIPFLLSLAALPACGPAVEDDPTVPDGGDPKKLKGSCEDALSKIYGCYGEEYEDEYVQEYVDEYVDEFCGEVTDAAREESDACQGAAEEIYACLASLDCDEITAAFEGDDGPPEACLDVFLDAHQRCPEEVGFCQGVTSSSGGDEGFCGQTNSGCLDGNAYGFECRTQDDQLACTCSINGEETSTASLSTVCGAESFRSEIAAACGFPDGALE